MPINDTLAKNVRIHNIKSKNLLRQILEETLVMVHLVTTTPTKVKLLVPKSPDVVIFTDASIEGIGGVIYYMRNEHSPLVFRIPFPEEISKSIKNTMQGMKEISISDAEALGLVAGLLVAIVFLNLSEKSIALFCDNTPTVGWVRRLASRSKRAARLMRILAILIKIANITPLITLSIEGSLNDEANYTTRYMCKDGKLLSNTDFLTNFNYKFSIKQGYDLARLSPKLTSKLIHEL